jgi:transposase
MYWSFAKRRLQKFNGVSKETFYLHLKECEWRFNNRSKNLYLDINNLQNGSFVNTIQKE